MQRCGYVVNNPNCSAKRLHNYQNKAHKKWQATYITLLRPSTLAVFPPWGIQQELVV